MNNFYRGLSFFTAFSCLCVAQSGLADLRVRNNSPEGTLPILVSVQGECWTQQINPKAPGQNQGPEGIMPLMGSGCETEPRTITVLQPTSEDPYHVICSRTEIIGRPGLDPTHIHLTVTLPNAQDLTCHPHPTPVCKWKVTNPKN